MPALIVPAVPFNVILSPTLTEVNVAAEALVAKPVIPTIKAAAIDNRKAADTLLDVLI